MKRLLILLLIQFSLSLSAQQVENYVIPSEGKIKLAEGIEIDKIPAGYTIWAGEGDIKGMIVFFHSRRDTVNADDIIIKALENDLAIMYVTTDNRLEFLFEISRMEELEGYINQACLNYSIPEDRLLYCGMSLAGTRALKIAIHGANDDSFSISPRAIAVCDAPLDMQRFYVEGKRAAALNYHPAAANEGFWVSSYLESNLGDPKVNDSLYFEYSPYAYMDIKARHRDALKATAIRCYTEPDVHWWMQERGKDYYGMNSTDLAGLINQQILAGNKEAELILTEDKGYRDDGSRHPHSWNIVDEDELVEWFLGMLEE